MDPTGRRAGGDLLTLEPTVGAVMLGSCATSACCCLVPRSGASRCARILAVAMVIVMATASFQAAPAERYAGGLFLLAVALALAVGALAERAGEVEWHRAAGAVLMACAVLIHQHGAAMATHPMPAVPGTGQDSLPALLVRIATVVYLGWLATTLLRLRHRPLADLSRWEHLAMAPGLTAMILFMPL